MKKLGLVLLAVVVLAYPVYPWAIGLALEGKINRQEDELTRNFPYLSIVERSYQRGWYSSQQEVTYELFSGLGKALGSASKISDPPQAESPPPSVATKPLRFTVHNDIHHGPLLRSLGLGLARIDTRFAMSEATRGALAKVFGKQEPLSIRTRLGLFGGGSTRVSSPAFTAVEIDQSGEKASSDGLDVEIKYSGHADRYTVRGGAPRFTVTGRGGTPQMLLRGLTIDADMHRLVRQLYTGKMKFAVAELSGGSQFALQDVNYGIDASARGELVDMAARIDVSRVDSPQWKARDLHYDFTLANLHAETIAKLQESVQDSFRAGGGDPTALALTAMSDLKKYGFELLKYDPELRLDQVGFTTGDGTLLIKGYVKTHGLTEADLNAASPLTLLRKLNADMQIRLSEKLLTQLAASRTSAGANPEAQAAADQQLEALISQGMIKREQGEIVSHLEFRDSKLTANGKTVWPPAGTSAGLP